MFGKLKSVSHYILILTFTLMSATLIFMTLPERGNAQQGKERVVQIKIFRDQPVEIVAVKVKGVSVEPK